MRVYKALRDIKGTNKDDNYIKKGHIIYENMIKDFGQYVFIDGYGISVLALWFWANVCEYGFFNVGIV